MNHHLSLNGSIFSRYFSPKKRISHISNQRRPAASLAGEASRGLLSTHGLLPACKTLDALKKPPPKQSEAFFFCETRTCRVFVVCYQGGFVFLGKIDLIRTKHDVLMV